MEVYYISIPSHGREEVLTTLIVEADNMVNSRPLAYVSSDALDHESLRPNHFLLSCTSGVAPLTGNFEEFELNWRKQWIVSQALANICGKRW